MDKCNIKASYKRDVLISMYPTHSVREIADFIGCNDSYLYKLAKEFGLCHTKETLKRIKEKQMANLIRAYDKDVVERRVRTRKKILRMERLRVMSGERQQTRLKVLKMPSKAYHAKRNLIARHGYFAFEGENYTIGYDKNTRRIDEERYKERYGFKFEEDLLCQEV